LKFLLLQIHLERSSWALRFRVPEKSPRLLPWIRNIIRLGLFLLILQFGSILLHDFLIEAAAKQQNDLFITLQKTSNRLDQIQMQMEATFRQEDLVHYKFGLKPPDTEERKLGRGGNLPMDSLFFFQIYPTRELRYGIQQQLANISMQINRSHLSFSDLSELIQDRYKHYRHIPSVSPSTGRFSSGYGYRTHPVTGERNKMHTGIDISNQRWTPIHATADGIITLTKYQDYFGNYVVLNHGNGMETKYGHMEKIMVKEGQRVRRYGLLGYMGRTGRTTGIHVHYEVWNGESHSNPTNYILTPESAVD